MNRGFTITAAGAALLTSLLAGEQLEITKVMVGKGKLAEDQEPADLTDLISPVALATSNTPTVSGQQVEMVVEYRNDLNGGLTEAFYLSEFGVWGKRVGDTAEAAMIYYATLGDYPQWVGPISGGLDVRRYPVAIGLATKDVSVQLNYPAGAFVTAEEFNTALLNKANWNDGLLQSGSILDWAQAKDANTCVATTMAVTDTPYAGFWAVEFYLYPSGIWRIIVVTDVQKQKRYYRVKSGNDPWSEWSGPIATSADLAGKAPVGYGLGTRAVDISSKNISEIAFSGKWGLYRGEKVVGAPSSDWHLYMLLPSYGDGGQGYAVMLAWNINTAKSYSCNIHGTTIDSWVLLATATPPQEHDLPLAEGMTRVGACKYFKTQDNVTTVYGDVTAQAINNGTVLAALPSGYRTSEVFEVPGSAVLASTVNSARTSCVIVVRSDGAISVQGLSETAMYCSFSASFVTPYGA